MEMLPTSRGKSVRDTALEFLPVVEWEPKEMSLTDLSYFKYGNDI